MTVCFYLLQNSKKLRKWDTKEPAEPAGCGWYPVHIVWLLGAFCLLLEQMFASRKPQGTSAAESSGVIGDWCRLLLGKKTDADK
eukprot:scaffold2096_cov145-Skeletonema_menzelii.AAC.1